MEEMSPQEQQARLLAVYEFAKEEAREGRWDRYFRLQWPELELDWFQVKLVDGLFNPGIREVFVKGCTGCGKSASAGAAVVAYYDVWDDAKVVVTSASSEHAVRVMFGEISKWFNSARITPVGQLLRKGIFDENAPDGKAHRLDIVNPDSEEGFAGGHGMHTLFLFDEGTAILDSRYDIADTQASKVLVLGNPRTLFGRFRSAFPKGDPDKTCDITAPFGTRRCITIDASTCINVKEKRLKVPVAPPGGITVNGNDYRYGERLSDEDFESCKMRIPGQIDYGKYKGMLEKADPWWVRVFVHAKFPQSDPETMIVDSEWLERHEERWKELDGGDYRVPQSFGLDVGGSEEGDPSVLTSMNEDGMVEQLEASMSTAGAIVKWVLDTCEKQYGINLKDGNNPIAVDMDGIGWGVGTDLQDEGVWVIEIRGNASSDVDRTVYGNKRAECYGELGKRLDPTINDSPFAMLSSSQLKEELCAPQKMFIGNDGRRFRVTPKNGKGGSENNVKKMLGGRSPDRADSVVYCYRAQDEFSSGGIASTQLDTTSVEIDKSWADIIPGDFDLQG